MAKQAAELRYAVRFRVVLKYFGQLCLVLAILTMVPLMVSLIFGERVITLRYAVVICGLAGLGWWPSRMRTPSRVQANEGMTLVTLMFLFTPLVMSYPLMSSGLSFADAFFEAVSAVTTTGLSARETLVDASKSFLFARAWMQWYGGLGIVVLSLALVMEPGLVAKGLAVAEAERDDLAGGTRAYARRVLKVYGILTVLGIIGCLALNVHFFDGLLYTFAAVSTGGFAPHDNSLANLSWFAQGWITLLCLAGATPFMVYYLRLKAQKHGNVGLLQLKAIVIAGVTVSLAVGGTMQLSGVMAWPQILHHAPLLSFSAQTTAGFASFPCAQLDSGSKLILTFSMLAGGGIGSTAGGFKLLRLLMAVSLLRLILLRTCLPKHAVIEPRLADRRLQDEEIRAALLLMLLYIGGGVLSWLPFVTMGYSPLDSLFEVGSALGTAGLSVGVTSTSLPALLKGILCADMLMGRLEIIAWLVLLFPGTWAGRRMELT